MVQAASPASLVRMHPSAAASPAPDGRFTEVADRTWVARHEWLDVNVTVVEGDRGLLVVDTLGSQRAARAMVAELRQVSSREVVAVVNTHEHFDHTFGNGTLLGQWPAITVHAHEEAAARTVESGRLAKEAYDEGDPHRDDVLATEAVPATTTFSSVAVVDLGDRVVELVHPGRGHTGGDVVVRVPDVDLLLAGDLVEESAPPSYGPDSFPLDWPAALEVVNDLLTPDTVVVPGHGGLVDKAFVSGQRGDIGMVAEAIFDAASRSVPLEEAARQGEWPFPERTVRDALRRGYDQVPRTARRLPLV
jgi:glyoxylase-like metal-dependent hydrolase (beta-lactamase superfamily II)